MLLILREPQDDEVVPQDDEVVPQDGEAPGFPPSRE